MPGPIAHRGTLVGLRTVAATDDQVSRRAEIRRSARLERIGDAGPMRWVREGRKREPSGEPYLGKPVAWTAAAFDRKRRAYSSGRPLDSQLSELSAGLEREHWWFTARALVIRSLAERLLDPTATVVDVGCGTGGVISTLSDAYRRVGVDPSERAIALARQRHRGVDFRVGRAPEGVRDELRATNLVLFCDVLEHIEDDSETLSRVVAPLPIGAKILITVPAHMSLWSPHDVSHGHFRRYERHDLVALWQDLPLNCQLLSPFNWRLEPVARLVRWVSRERGKAPGPANTDLVLLPRPVNRVLHHVFASERHRLLAALGSEKAPVSRRGVSWIAVLEREP